MPLEGALSPNNCQHGLWELLDVAAKRGRKKKHKAFMRGEAPRGFAAGGGADPNNCQHGPMGATGRGGEKGEEKRSIRLL